MKRHLIWLPSGKKADENARPICPAIPLPDGCNPNELWVIRGFNDKDILPPPYHAINSQRYRLD
ncbi:hypothetical protein I3271_09285 [Photobacterium leiognathi]|uniref:hypothetical protein n=1 Tax=Photobacterium leiognathi TaxID=553611 RepID=UPI001EE11DE7|nr:hypothetical protein [Photobacterium leiognathi]MCG3884881.1 hypothetical protein [Photobacterium leiognathi]